MAEAADPPERKRIIEHLFRALTEINAEGHAVRRPQKFADLCKVTGGDEEALRDILDHFRAEGISFLSPYGDAPIEPGTLIDISHEALIRSWAKLADKKEGWLQREFNDGLIWRSLIVQAESFRRDPKSVLSPARTEELDPWLAAFPPDWSERYGGGWSDVQKLMGASREARDEEERRHREFQETKRREAEARAQRAEEAGRAAEAARQAAAMLAATEQELRAAQTRRTKVAFAAALVCLILTAIAMAGGFYALQQKERADLAAEQAQEQAKRADLAAEEAQEEARRADAAVIETKAGSYWNQLQLWGYPIERRDVATLWRLTQEDDTVLGEFVRQLANSPDLLARFGLKPQPIARAVGLTWPDQARQIITQSMADLASGQLDLKRMRAFVLVSHTRALVALAPWLDPATLESGTQEIADAINNLAATRQLTDQQLWALAEMVGAFAERFEWEPIEPARRRLREMIESAEPSGSAGLRGQAISRAIEVMAPFLEPEERSRAVQYLVPLLGQNTDSWAAEAAPRALTALLPKLDRSQSDTALGGMPPAIAKIAVEQSSGDSSYLLTLMQVPETLADKGDQAAVAAFGRALLDQLKLPNQPRQHAALAHASLALLPRLPAGPTAINRHVADTTALIPGTAALDLEQRLDPVQRSLLRESVRNETAEALSHAASSPDAEQRRRQAEAVLLRLRSAWNAEPSPDAASNPYRRAAQMRLLAVLAPSLTPDSAARATEKLAEILPTTQDHIILAAIARALAEMAPNLSDTDRDKAIEPAMDALAMTGSTEEAIAWAKAIAALLSSDPRAATAQIVEALKYPTATGTPTDILLEGLAKPWPEDFEKIAGKKLPDPDVLDWLRAHLPERYDLSDPPKPPPGLQTTPG